MTVARSSPRPQPSIRPFVFIAALTALAPGGRLLARQSTAPNGAQAQTPNLATASLEDLMNMQITSASRREQRLIDTAAAVYVIPHDAIIASGRATIPELLRLAPGVNVARIDGNTWAVSIRGFNSRWSNKLLVLVDGRSVYERVDSGVYWDMLDVPMEDIDRIEVIRGPGSSVWGANAVDGVINILTRPARDTRGTVVRADAGRFDARTAAVHYGGGSQATPFRVFAQFSESGPSHLPDTGAAGGDDWRRAIAGFRVDGAHGSDAWTLEGNAAHGTTGVFGDVPTEPIPPAGGWQPVSWTARWTDGNALTTWTHTFSPRSSLRLQGSFDAVDRRENGIRYQAMTAQFGLQHQIVAGRHTVISGADFLVSDDRTAGTYVYSVGQPDADLLVGEGFVQDEVRLAGDRLRATGGVKVSHDTLGGWGTQPTARVLWSPNDRHRIWGAVSRSLRTPAVVDRSMVVNVPSFIGQQGLPIQLALLGNPGYLTEEVQSVEAGYRVAITRRLDLDLAWFYAHNERMQTFETQTPELRFDQGRPYLYIAQVMANLLSARTRGLEAAAHWQTTAGWSVDAVASTFRIAPNPASATKDPNAALNDGNAPRYSWQIRSSLSLGRDVSLNGALYGVGALRVREVPAYVRGDLAADWRVTPSLSVVAAGQNLFGAGHIEFGGTDNAATPTLVEPTGSLRVIWRFGR